MQKNEFELLLIIYTLFFFLMFLVAMLLPLLENMALLNFSLVLGSPLRDCQGLRATVCTKIE